MDPVKLVRDADNNCKCPKCGANLKFIEGEPVKIVDGKLNMQDSEDHYKCEICKVSYRQLVHTEYYQWYND